MELILQEQSPIEFFKEQVEASLSRQRIRASEFSSYYLVNLLSQYVRLDQKPGSKHDEPLAVRLAQALQTAGVEQRSRLRSLGDFSLFTAGFFSDSFRRQLIDVDYYISMGEYAYRSLSKFDEDFRELFAELSQKFVGFTDVLSDVSERTKLTSNQDLLRVYEKWLRTGSKRDSQRLLDKGIVPNSSIGKRFMQ